MVLSASHWCFAQQPEGKYRIARGVDSFSNGKTTAITIQNNDPNPDIRGQPAFVIVCAAKDKRNWVEFQLYTGGLDSSEMSYDSIRRSVGHFESKCGNENPRDEYWPAVTSGSLGNTLVYTNPPRRYTRHLASCKSWGIRYQGSGGGRTTSFDLSALQQELDKYPECKQ